MERQRYVVGDCVLAKFCSTSNVFYSILMDRKAEPIGLSNYRTRQHLNSLDMGICTSGKTIDGIVVPIVIIGG